MFKSAKTFILLAALSGLLLLVGEVMSSRYGGGVFWVFLFVALAMNVGGYFFSDKIAIAAARARPMSEQEFPDIYAMVRQLSLRAGEPMPRLYMSPSPQLNAFATGRNPKHAAVCINAGLYQALTPEELEGVLGHELQHVYNRDILVGAVAAMIATAITFLARMALYASMFSGGGGRDRDGGGPLAALVMAILSPIAALLIQMAVTRSRETMADRTGAELTGKPLALASALRKLDAAGNDRRFWQRGATPAETNPAFAHMYIAAPFGGRAFMKLFSTHPPIEDRIEALEEMARARGQLAPGQYIS